MRYPPVEYALLAGKITDSLTLSALFKCVGTRCTRHFALVAFTSDALSRTVFAGMDGHHSSALDQSVPESTMQPSELDELRSFFEGVNDTIAEIDRMYVAEGVYYHCIDPDVRGEVATGGNGDRHFPFFEYRVDDEHPPTIIMDMRGLDTTVRNAKFLLRRGNRNDEATLKALRDDLIPRFEALGWDVEYLRSEHRKTIATHLGWRDATVPGEGVERFHVMGPVRQGRFLFWASQLGEIQVARKLGMLRSKYDIVQLVLGDEERMMIEWPGVIGEERNTQQEGNAADAAEDPREQGSKDAEQNLSEVNGMPAAIQLL